MTINHMVFSNFMWYEKKLQRMCTLKHLNSNMLIRYILLNITNNLKAALKIKFQNSLA